jgi:hypothetical protein
LPENKLPCHFETLSVPSARNYQDSDVNPNPANTKKKPEAGLEMLPPPPLITDLRLSAGSAISYLVIQGNVLSWIICCLTNIKETRMANVFQLDHILLPRILQQSKLPSASAPAPAALALALAALALAPALAPALALAPLAQV